MQPLSRARWLCFGLLAMVVLATSCRPSRPSPARLTVAAAANLTGVMAEIGKEFSAQTGIETVFSYGSTAQLARQIEHGAPFDLFASADTEHIDQLVALGRLDPQSRAIYASGQLALWIPEGERAGIRQITDLTRSSVRYIAIAQPDAAPYGRASVEALKHHGLWAVLQPKIVYANSVSSARQMCDSGNADAAFTAYSLVLDARGIVSKIDPATYQPLSQALAINPNSPRLELARRFRDFVLGVEGRRLLAASGYLLPGAAPQAAGPDEAPGQQKAAPRKAAR